MSLGVPLWLGLGLLLNEEKKGSSVDFVQEAQ